MYILIRLAVSLVAVTTTILFAGDSTSSKAETHPDAHSTMGTHHHDVSMPMSEQKATNKPMKSKKPVLSPQTTCPVMGGAIDKKHFVDYQGKRIYMCCPGCTDAIAKNPEKYIKKLASMGQAVEIIEKLGEEAEVIGTK